MLGTNGARRRAGWVLRGARLAGLAATTGGAAPHPPARSPRTPAATPPGQCGLAGLAGTPTPVSGGVAAASPHAAGELTTPDAVISAKMVPFRDVAEMQQQNKTLLRAVRRMADEHEAELHEKESAADAQVRAALAEVEEMREASRRQQHAEQHHASRTLREHEHEHSPPNGVAPFLAVLSSSCC